jgi:hypothetical protein
MANLASVVANDFVTDFGDFLQNPLKGLDEKKTKVNRYKKVHCCCILIISMNELQLLFN